MSAAALGHDFVRVRKLEFVASFRFENLKKTFMSNFLNIWILQVNLNIWKFPLKIKSASWYVN